MSNIQTSLSNAFDSFTRKLNSYRQTPLEKQVSEATSNENWGVANSTLIELARATADYNNYSVVMKGIWEGISDKKERWRRIYKSLVLLEYCVKHGAERCADEAKGESYRLRPLHDFKFMEEGRDKGAGIRDKAKQLTDLLADPETLRAERNKAREGKEKYSGVSSNSAGGQTMVTPTGYAGSYGGGRAGNAIAAASVGNTGIGNSTNKLDEYREKERQRLEAKRAEELKAAAAAAKNDVPKVAPKYTESGKLVVKAPVLKGRKSDDSGSSSSSSSNDSNDGGNLIDFDAPVKPAVVQHAAPAQQKPAVCSPAYPAWKTGDPIPQQPQQPVYQQQHQAVYQQPPQSMYQPQSQGVYQAQPVYQPVYQQAQPVYSQPGYQQQAQPFNAFNTMHASPGMQAQPNYPSYGYPAQHQPTYNNPYGQQPQHQPMKEQPRASTNPFDAFNGL